MAYLGNRPAESFASFEKQVFTIVNSQTAYTLSHSVTNENDIRLVVNSVVQEPGSGKAYTASGTTLTLSAALTNGTDTMYCVFLGRALQTVNPPNASVGSDQTAPTIITGQTAETSIATDDTILIHDTSASALRKMTRANFVSGIGGTNTPYFYAYKSSSQTGLTNDADTKYQADTEGFDSDGCYNNTGSTVTLNSISTPSYSFAPNVAGKYVLFGSLLLSAAQQGDGREGALRFFKNGSGLNYIESTGNYTSYSFKKFRITSEIIVDANGTSDYFHITGRVVFNTNGQIQSGDEASFFGAYKLIT